MVSTAVTAWHGGTFGLAVNYDTGLVYRVTANGPGAGAGIRAGDRLVYDTSATRAIFASNATPDLLVGMRRTFRFQRGARIFDAAMTTTLETPHERARAGVYAVVALCGLVLGTLALLSRPNMIGLSLWLISLELMSLGIDFVLPYRLAIVQTACEDFCQTFGYAGFLLFALCIGGESGARRRWARIVAAGAVVTFAANAGFDETLLIGGHPYSVLTQGAFGWFVISCAGTIGLLTSLLIRRPEQRARLSWIMCAVVFLMLPPIFPFAAPILNFALPPSATVPLELINAAGFALLVFSVLRHHLFDLRFVIGRAVVYGALTSAVVGGMALLDWSVGNVLSKTRLALPLEALAAIAIGFWLNGLHDRIAGFVDGIFFRERRLGEERLARVARGLEEASDVRLMAAAMVDEAAGALQLASAALFVRGDDDAYRTIAARGWDGDEAVLLPGSAAILHIAGEDEPFRVDEALALPRAPMSGASRPRVVVPIRARRRLVAVAVYGSHASGTDVDPEEIAALRRLAVAAGHAYDRAELDDLRHINDELRSALAASFAAG